MMYVDTSALLKRYVEEPDSDRAEGLLRLDPDWLTARHTLAAAVRALGNGAAFLTFDGRQAAAARLLGLDVRGA